MDCMYRIIFLFSIVLLTSCNYFEQKKVYSEDLVEEELKSISFNDVDDFPSFENCDDISNKADRKRCFETTLISHVNTYLTEQTIIVSKDLTDTVSITFEVAKTGDIEIVEVDMNSESRLQIDALDSLIHHSIKTLPKIYPAIKRGQAVKTRFKLPIVIDIKT